MTREYQRHRTWSYNETSGRYKILEPRFYIPNKDRPLVQTGKVGAYKHEPGSPEQHALMSAVQRNSIETAWHAYETQLQAGIAKEVARNILPVNIMTQFYATANPLNVLKFMILRSEANALHEIREVSMIEEALFKAAMPLTYAAFSEQREFTRKVKRLMELVDIDALLADLEGVPV